MTKIDSSKRQPINIVFDGPPSYVSGRFFEVETDSGEGIKVGEWLERLDGLWALRISELPPIEDKERPDPQLTFESLNALWVSELRDKCDEKFIRDQMDSLLDQLAEEVDR